MYKHILVPTDGSRLSAKALATAGELARRLKARVTALHVIPPYRPPIADEVGVAYATIYTRREYKASTEASARRMLEKARKSFARDDVPCATRFVTDDRPWQAIIKAARANKCDLIVMASHGRHGLEGLLLGSETQKVLTHSKTPVLVCR